MSIISKQQNGVYPNSIVDEEWEYLDPTPDIHVLFLEFDDRFFGSKLKSVVVKWSPRMTVCAGLCRYEGRRSGHCSISLSVPLLKLRPRKDLVETLLHEMIHAFLFLTNNNRDRDGHGPEFQYHMHRINQESGTKITIYHSFHDEVKLYKQHWWKCSGPCQHRRPFYGLVKRSMNRAPGPNDNWWATHQASCGGSFVKIKEPEGYGVKKKKQVDENKEVPDSKKQKMEMPSGSRDIRGFLASPTSGPSTSKALVTAANVASPLPKPQSNNTSKGKSTTGFSGKKASPSKDKPISGYFGTSSNPSKGKTVTGFVGMVKNKGSSTVTVTSPSVGSAKTVKTEDARPTQGGIVSKPTSLSSFIPFTGQGNLLGGCPQRISIPSTSGAKQSTSSIKKETTKVVEIVLDDSHNEDSPEEKQVPCPICQSFVALSQINTHLDSCLQ